MPLLISDYIRRSATLSKIFSDNPLIFGLVLTVVILLITYFTFPMAKSRRTATRFFKYMIYVGITLICGMYVYYSVVVTRNKPPEKSLLRSREFFEAGRTPRDGLEVMPLRNMTSSSSSSSSSVSTATGLSLGDQTQGPSASGPGQSPYSSGGNSEVAELFEFEKSDDVLSRLSAKFI